MASPRSKRLAGPTLLVAAAAEATLYTCPVGKVALVKSVRAVTGSGSAAALRLGIDGTGASTRFLSVSVAATSQFIDPDTDPVVLVAGETVRGITTGNDVTVTLSGAELTA